MPPTCYLSALWDLQAIHTSKHGFEKLTQQVAWLVKSKRKEDNNYYEPLWQAFK